MPVALKPGTTREFILKAERKLEKPTKFLLRNLTLAQREFVAKASMQASSEEESSALEPLATACRIGLAGWSDFLTEDGDPYVYEDEQWDAPSGERIRAVKRELLDVLTVPDINELALAIFNQNRLSETDQGNSQRSD
jgi:hypothetical protein